MLAAMTSIADLLSPPAQTLLDQVQDARARRTCLRIRGGGSKDHVGDITRGEVLDTRSLLGIIAHEPSELVLTAALLLGDQTAALKAAEGVRP